MASQRTTAASSATTEHARLERLLMLAAAMDRDAFAELYDATAPRLYGLAVRIVRDHALAEDVLSDVYLQVWRTAGDYDPARGTVLAWLGVMCRSRALDALRRWRGRDATGVERDSVDLSSETPPAPLDVLEAFERGTRVHAAVAELTAVQRELVGLAYFRGYTHQELAAFLDMPLGTVKTHLHRALKALRRAFELPEEQG